MCNNTVVLTLTLFSPLSGNDWGCNKNGKCGVGYGDRQEEFYACSDVTINSRNSRFTPMPQPVRTTPTTRPTTTRPTTTTRWPTTWRYPSTTTTTTRRTYPTYSTRPQWPTYPTRAPTTTTTRKPSGVYNYNYLYDYFRRYPNAFPTGTSIRFPGSGNSNNNNNRPSGRSAEEDFLSAILGRDSVVINRDGLSVPVPVVDGSSPVVANDTDMSNYLTKDRFCAACQYNCDYIGCYNYCPETRRFC